VCQDAFVNSELTVADYVTRAMLLSSMVAVFIGIALVLVNAQSAGAVVVGLGLSGTIGFGIVRSGLARAFKQSAKNAQEHSARTS
jgi:hypothetical protein